MKVALVGQPNCGKSTLFNAVAGYRSTTGNFEGTTVELARSQVRVNGCFVDLADLPGLYSLTGSTPAERAAKHFLLESRVDVVVNVLDASLLSRSLELTLELREMGIPMVVCLNMMDEAQRKGIAISSAKLAELLQLPVAETIAYRGEGVRELFDGVIRQGGQIPPPVPSLRWQRDIVSVVELMQNRLGTRGAPIFPPEPFIAVKLLEGDSDLTAKVSPEACLAAARLRDQLLQAHGRPPESVIMSERHDRATHLFEQVATVGRPRPDLREAFDSILTHPLWGYLILLSLLVGFFYAVFGVGAAVEETLQAALGAAFQPMASQLAEGTLSFAVLRSLWDGFAGGAAILLPYLVPFLVGLALLEDIGYLPRVAYLMDALLHRVGLHGSSVVPIILGYGCSVPACLATRVLPSGRDRFLASLLATLVPCSARTTVIFALVASYLGPGWALGLYAFNGVVVFLSGWLLTRIWPETSAGMVMAVPRYQRPSLRVVTSKAWLRLREFILISWPLLIAGSLVLGLGEFCRLDQIVNAGLSPLTKLLGLPVAVGTTLVFGILRKELSLLLLMHALGTPNVTTVMTPTQIMVFTVFLMFYIPCLATIVTMTREIGRHRTLQAIAYTLLLAIVMSLATRFFLQALL